MRNICIFVEDYGHETVMRSILQRFSEEFGVDISISLRNTRGGHGKAISELETFIKDLQKGKLSTPDLLLVAIDANCKGFTKVKNEIERVTKEFSDFLVCAVPDPHIERWLLLDSSAFKAALGKGCTAPNQKCERDRYKILLQDAVKMLVLYHY